MCWRGRTRSNVKGLSISKEMNEIVDRNGEIPTARPPWLSAVGAEEALEAV